MRRPGETRPPGRDGPAAIGAPPPRPGDAGRDAASARAHRYRLRLRPVLEAIARETGRSAAAIAPEMTRRGIRKPRGGAVWTPADIRKLLRRLGLEAYR